MSKYRIKNLWFYLFFIFFSLACQSREKDTLESRLKIIIKNNIGKKLILPDSLRAYYISNSNCIADSNEISNANYKIYSHINASCPTCIRDIKLWNRIIINYFSNLNVPVILVCNSKDNFELIKYIFEKGEIEDFSYPLFFDKKNEYTIENTFMKESQHLKTVLTDKENRILLFGNPIRSQKIKELYIKEIRRHK